MPGSAILAAPISLCSAGWLALASDSRSHHAHSPQGAVSTNMTIGHALAYAAVCVSIPVLLMLPRLLSLPFSAQWAAYTFPLDITAISMLMMGRLTGQRGWHIIGGVTVMVCSAVVVLVWTRVLYRAGTAMLKACS